MPASPWTYDTLAQADNETLEQVLLDCGPPDPEQLNGYIYCGWNHEWAAGVVSGQKFKKAFWPKDGKNLGYNEIVIQDHKKHQGDWEVQMVHGRPNQLGYFRVSMTKDEPPEKLYEPYLHTAHFNYDLPLNDGVNAFFRLVRDFVVLPNADDHTLMLCKAYLHFGPTTDLFYCYFLLGHRKPIEYFAW